LRKGTVYKDYYEIDEELRIAITTLESREEVQAYFDFLEDCKANNICSECGCEIEVDETWMKDEIAEYQHSVMCKDCQRDNFGR
jgi:hypothetical protein